ncbi:hypothetical protein T10_12012 [Trichinella papuae]|uniref:Uncharacterized protein n=1 Tax=Trichinella papuae TaxID=268474 RepID=A0A0V1N9H7_9BILA|nr:hypothetical protein T10_12012 [Trichinella papuae]
MSPQLLAGRALPTLSMATINPYTKSVACCQLTVNLGQQQQHHHQQQQQQKGQLANTKILYWPLVSVIQVTKKNKDNFLHFFPRNLENHCLIKYIIKTILRIKISRLFALIKTEKIQFTAFTADGKNDFDTLVNAAPINVTDVLHRFSQLAYETTNNMKKQYSKI